MRKMTGLRAAFLGSVALCAPGLVASATEIGSVAAVNRLMEGTPPTATKRVLEIGNGVVTDELIETTEIGSGQLMFLDQTTLTVAPSSNIVLDRYVYDPDRQAGEIAVSMTKGAMRFIGGRITKGQTAIIRTPTATIGIRGAIVLIEVDENGETRVTLIAGSFVSMRQYGDGDGDGLDDGPVIDRDLPFALGQGARPLPGDGGAPRGAPRYPRALAAGQSLSTASAGDGSQGTGPGTGATGGGSAGGGSGQGQDVLLSRPNATGTAGPGGVRFDGIASSGALAGIYRQLEGTRSGGTPQPPTPQQVDGAIRPLAAINSDVRGGETRQPVSTSGEQSVGAPPPPDGNTEREDNAPPAGINPPTDFVDGGNGGTGGGGTGGGGTGGGGTGGGGTGGGGTGGGGTGGGGTGGGGTGGGTGGGGGTGTAGGFLNPVTGTYQPFASVVSGSLIGTTADGTQLTVFVPETSADLERTIFFQPAPTPFAASLRPDVGYFGFFDTDGDAAQLSGFGPLSGFGFSDIGLGFHFVNIFADDPNGELLFGYALFGTPSPGQQEVASFDDGTISPSANTADIYRFEPLGLGGATAEDNAQLYLVANGGEARYAGTSGRAAGGGRVLGAGISFAEDRSRGVQLSDFGVFVAPIETPAGGSGLIVSEPVLSSFVDGLELTYSSNPSGFLEDAAGNSVFGPNGEYVVLASVNRGEGSAGALEVRPGTESFRNGETITTNENLIGSVATLDPNARIIETDTRPLAGDLTSRSLTFSGDGTIDDLFATGMAVCSTGNCGPVVQGETTFAAGATPLRTIPARTNGSLLFYHGDGPNRFFQTDDTNAIDASLVTESSTFYGPNSQRIFVNFENYTNFGTEAQGAYLNDRIFALTYEGGVSVNGDVNATPGSFFLASSNLVGTAGLPGSFQTADLDHQYLRWGWWSATYETADPDGTARRDIVHLGNFVAGNKPDPADVPTNIAATYSGFASATTHFPDSGNLLIEGGTFGLTYDFRERGGSFRLTLGARPEIETFVIGDQTNAALYATGPNSPGSAQLDVTGAFYAGGGDPVAATGGTFYLDELQSNARSHSVGVFGGDRQ